MNSRIFYVATAIIATTLFVGTSTVTGQTNLTSWGKPNLQGVWDFRSLTPMERPENIAGKEVFTEEEAATFSEEFLVRESRDLADAEAEAAESGRVVPYNDFWFDCCNMSN